MKKTFLPGVVIALAALLLISSGADAQDFKIRGRLHMDGIYGINDAELFSNGFNNRRARMGMTGKINENWSGIVEVDFADATLDPKDFMLSRSFSNGGALKIGQYKVPQGLNQLTSSNSITFIERTSDNNVFPDSRKIGVGYTMFKPTFGLESMVFGRGLGQRGTLTNDMPIGAGFRGTFFPKLGEGQFHIGASVVYQHYWGYPELRFNDRPETRDSKGGSVRFLDVKVADAKSTLKSGVELLYIHGPFSIEGEYLQMGVNRKDENNPSFNGYHVQASYVLTGEKRSYRKGSPGGITPKGDKGAWEVALRYSAADLNDEISETLVFKGGEQNNLTVALNHYVTSKLRFMANVIFMNTDKLEDKSPVVGVVRAQFNF